MDILNINGREYSLTRLRTAYRIFLNEKYPKLQPRSIKTKVDDAFAILAWEGAERFEQLLLYRDSNQLAERFASEYLAKRKHPMKDARGYVRALKEFQGFLSVVVAIDSARVRLPRQIHVDDTSN